MKLQNLLKKTEVVEPTERKVELSFNMKNMKEACELLKYCLQNGIDVTFEEGENKTVDFDLSNVSDKCYRYLDQNFSD